MKLVSYVENPHAASLPSPSIPTSCAELTSEAQQQHQQPRSSSLQQFYQILERLHTDLLACDARLSLFVAAANSYRYETLLRPFPKEFMDDNQRPDIDAIFDVIADMDRLETIMQQLTKGNYNCYQINIMKLLHAVLVRHGERVALSTLQPSEFEDLYVHLKILAPEVTPSHIFEVTPSLKCAHTKDYTCLRERYPVRIGFYGAKLEHLYAMLTVGNLPLNEPLTLCCNVDEAWKRCRQSPGWGGSRCGAILSCVAVVEYVVVPALVSVDEVKCNVIINDASCMQISYLMVYGQSFDEYETAMMQQPKFTINWMETVKWMEENKYALSLGAYLLILSLSTPSGRGIFHKFATTGLYVLRKGFLKI